MAKSRSKSMSAKPSSVGRSHKSSAAYTGRSLTATEPSRSSTMRVEVLAVGSRGIANTRASVPTKSASGSLMSNMFTRVGASPSTTRKSAPSALSKMSGYSGTGSGSKSQTASAVTLPTRNTHTCGITMECLKSTTYPTKSKRVRSQTFKTPTKSASLTASGLSKTPSVSSGQFHTYVHTPSAPGSSLTPSNSGMTRSRTNTGFTSYTSRSGTSGMPGTTRTWSPLTQTRSQTQSQSRFTSLTGDVESQQVVVVAAPQKKKDNTCCILLVILFILLLLCLGAFGIWYLSQNDEEPVKEPEDPTQEPLKEGPVTEPIKPVIRPNLPPRKPVRPVIRPPRVIYRPNIIRVPVRPPPRRVHQQTLPPIQDPEWMRLLKQNNFDRYVNAFEQQGLDDMKHWKTMTNDNYVKLGMVAGDRKRFHDIFGHSGHMDRTTGRPLNYQKEPWKRTGW